VAITPTKLTTEKFEGINNQKKLQAYNQIRSRIFGNDLNEVFRAEQVGAIYVPYESFLSGGEQNKKITGFLCNQQLLGWSAICQSTIFRMLRAWASNISCIGSTLAKTEWSKYPQFTRIASNVKTADGKSHHVVGCIKASVIYKRLVKSVKFIIIPPQDIRVILAIDFWKSFELAPNLISSVEAQKNNSEHFLSKTEYPLTVKQRHSYMEYWDSFHVSKSRD